MSVEGVVKLVDELAGGSPPFRAFGESLRKELEEVDMTDKPEEEVVEEAEAPLGEPPTETDEVKGDQDSNPSDPEDERTEEEVEASKERVR